MPFSSDRALANFSVQRASVSFWASFAGSSGQISAAVLPALIAAFSSFVLRCLGAADELDNDVDIVARGERGHIILPGEGGEIDAPLPMPIAGRHGGDHDRPAGAPGDELRIGFQQLHDAGPNSAEPGEADAKGGGHGGGCSGAGRWVEGGGVVDGGGVVGRDARALPLQPGRALNALHPPSLTDAAGIDS